MDTTRKPDIREENLRFRGALVPRSKTEYLILHHAAASGTVQAIHQAHLNRGWIGIGYHYYVRKDGTIWRGRAENSIGAHTVGYNGKAIGICFEGNFETETMDSAQLTAGRGLIRDILLRNPALIVGGHRDFDNTACPGKNFPTELLSMNASEEALYMDIETLLHDITDEQAYQLLEKAQHHAAQLPPPAWAEEDLKAAVAAGITDGERPLQLIPRYQAAIMAARAKGGAPLASLVQKEVSFAK